MQKILTKKGPYRKVRFALKLKDCLQKTLDDLAIWQSMLDPSLFLLSRVPSTVVDQQLRLPEARRLTSAVTIKDIRDELQATKHEKQESLFIPSDTLDPKRELIPFSFSHKSHDRRTSAPVIVDTVLCHALTDLEVARKDVRNLARVLSKIDPLVFGLLSCQGVIKYFSADDNLHPSFELIFSIPPGLRLPTSLRSILVAERDDHALNDRLDLAKQVASSVLFIHNSGFVHKNLRPETVLVFSGESSALQHSFIVGFENFRPIDRLTYRTGNVRWEQNLYQHPKRQGLTVEEDFKMQHDIYSLGVCLLELGLWTSFVKRVADEDNPVPNKTLGIDDLLELKDSRKRATEIKKILTKLAEERLPVTMGRKYAQVVMACLTCLDKDSTLLGNEADFLDEDGIVVAVRYIEKILMRIKEISI